MGQLALGVTYRVLVYLASKNQHKAAEYAELLKGSPVTLEALPPDVPDAPEDGTSFAANAIQKARYYARFVQAPVLSDDSGLVVPCLGGEPGILSARYAGVHGDDRANNAKLISKLQAHRRSAAFGIFICSMAYVKPNHDDIHVFHGITEGVVTTSARGYFGFGYDPLFFLPVQNKTLAELSAAEKNLYSHRSKAVRALLQSHLPEFAVQSQLQKKMDDLDSTPVID